MEFWKSFSHCRWSWASGQVSVLVPVSLLLIQTLILILILSDASVASTAAESDRATAPLSTQSLIHLPLIPYRRQKARRNLLKGQEHEDEEQQRLVSPRPRRREDAVQVGALYQGYGTHYVDLWVGTPKPQRQTLIVDTGSGVTAFPCAGCSKDCGTGYHVDDFFDETKSPTFSKVDCNSCSSGRCSGSPEGECRISMSYQEGSSWSAFEAVDQAYIGGPHDHALDGDDGGHEDIDPGHAAAFAFPLTFGCQTHLTGLFKTQLADGIMGMDDAPTAFWSQMHAANKIPNQQFSMCFSRQDVADKGGTESGAMTLGGFDERLHSSPLVYAARQGGRSGFYNVYVRKIYLRDGSGGDRARATDPNAKLIKLDVAGDDLNHGNVIVDSGTTDTYFTRKIATEFNAAYHELTGKTYSHSGVSLSPEELNALPTILMQIAGDDVTNKEMYPDVTTTPGFAVDIDKDFPYDILLAIPASHYMELDDKLGKYVARFYPDEGGGSVIGANAMMGHDVFFDLDNRRIGFAESDCDYFKLITENGFVDTLHSGDNDSNNNKNSAITPTPEPQQNPDTESNESHDGTNPSDKDTIHSNVHPAIAACSDTMCRVTVGGTLVGFLIIGLLIGRCCCQRKSVVYRRAGGEMEMNHLDDFADVRYRDEPEGDDENGVAPNGVGYKDEPIVRSIT